MHSLKGPTGPAAVVTGSIVPPTAFPLEFRPGTFVGEVRSQQDVAHEDCGSGRIGWCPEGAGVMHGDRGQRHH